MKKHVLTNCLKSFVIPNSTQSCAGTVYDYYFYVAGSGQWNVWTDSISKEESKIPDGASVRVFFCSNNASTVVKMYALPPNPNSWNPNQVGDLIIPTMETARQKFFLHIYLAHEVPMLFVGPTGTGKSVINKNFLVKLPKDKYTPNCIDFSARTSSTQTQDIVMAKLDRRRKGVFGPPVGKKCIVYVGKY